MMIQEQINRLATIVSNEVNEAVLVDSGREVLDQLFASYGSEKHLFSDKDIESLERLKKQIEAIEAFVEELGEFPYIEFKEEVDEAIGRLFFVVEQVNGLKVAGRINKEIRVLHEKKKQLPNRAEYKQSVKKRALENDAPSCRFCQEKMVLREGPHSAFWGCSAFPECWGKRWLTNEERDLLG